ncbi:MAG: hypothetical protein A2283_01140 [Lentisphaerae bacterium RIFOXYA12_FULL_48_11]|nr:MAG: hypothetical protein A2283_01140 [Lentisphaerae bacterium RIFOXYA12_FULL_48_11]
MGKCMPKNLADNVGEQSDRQDFCNHVEYKPRILILSPTFAPSLGGVETHLSDLVYALDGNGYKLFLLTHSPIGVDRLPAPLYERIGRCAEIFRFKWISGGVYDKIEKYPFLAFLYMAPYMMIRSFLWLLKHCGDIDIIHAQGLSTGFMGVIFKVLFRKKMILSTHAIYEMPPRSISERVAGWIVRHADVVMAVSNSSFLQMRNYGVAEDRLSRHRYWVDLYHFRNAGKEKCRTILGLDEKFMVLFVGRLMQKKGTSVLINVAKLLPDVNFVFVGIGEDTEMLAEVSRHHKNIIHAGPVPNNELTKYYSAADLLCIPSQYEEGLGRVVMEAVACGTPVVGANKGGIPDALDDSVSILVDPTVENIKTAISWLVNNKSRYLEMVANCRPYAERNFGSANLDLIIKHYVK